jgi:hypothetical protein
VEECPRCGRPLCKEDSPPEHLRCRFCERDYWRRLHTARVIAIFAVVGGAPVAAGLVLLGLGQWFDGFVMLILGPAAVAAVRAYVVGKRSSMRKEFLAERKPRALGAGAAEE